MEALRVSAHTDGFGFPLQSERLFCCAGEILPVRHHLTARPHNSRLLFPDKAIYDDLIKDLLQKLRSRSVSIQWQMPKMVPLMAEA